MKKILSVCMAFFLLLNLSFPLVAEEDMGIADQAANPFTDVTKELGNTTYKAILWAYETGIVKGTSADTYSPTDHCTRAQLCVMLWRLKGKPAVNVTDNPFPDVTTALGNTTYKAILWAYQQGIVKGNADGTFNPSGDTTRANMAVMLWRTAGKPAVSAEDNPFDDVSKSLGNTTYKSILWAFDVGLTKGTDKTHFSPNDPCTRAQLAVFLYRLNHLYHYITPEEPSPEPTGNDTLRVASDTLSGEFSPFFAERIADQNVVTLTQVPLLPVDRQGKVLLQSSKGETSSYFGTDYTYQGVADAVVTEDANGTMTVDITLRNDIYFSDGVKMTIDDVIFTMYVLADPSYDGDSTFAYLPITGLAAYRENFGPLYQFFISFTRENTDFTDWSKATQESFWKEYDEAVDIMAQEIVDYVMENWGEESLEDAAAAWGYPLDPGATIRDFGRAMQDAYDADVKSLFMYESPSGKTVETYFPTFPNYRKAIKIGESAESISGIVRTSDYSLRLYFESIHAPNLEKLTFPIAAKHYYGTDFSKGNLEQIREKSSKPLGAGPYVFEEFKDGSVKLSANSRYYRGAPKIKTVVLTPDTSNDSAKLIAENGADIDGLYYDVASIYSHNSNQQLNGDKLTSMLSYNPGYGYIGFNADLVNVGGAANKDSAASKALRKAFATVFSVYRETVIWSYYGELAEPVEYPVSKSSWTYPEEEETAFGKDANGNSIYRSTMSESQKEEAALNAAKGWLEKAGYTFTAKQDGTYSAKAPSGAKLSYTFMVPGHGNGEHPAYDLAVKSSALLAKLGITLNVDDVESFTTVLNDLAEGTVEIWTAAWGTTQDPDIYMIYRSDNASGNNYYSIADTQLDSILENALKTTDQDVRENLYQEAYDIIMDWGVIVPYYQRMNVSAYSTERIKVSSMPKDISVYYSWMNEIHTIELN